MTEPHSITKRIETTTLFIWSLVAARLALTLVHVPFSLSRHKTDPGVWFIALFPVLVCGFLAFATRLRLPRRNAKLLSVCLAVPASFTLIVWEFVVNAILGEPANRLGFLIASAVLDFVIVAVFLTIRLLRPVYANAPTQTAEPEA